MSKTNYYFISSPLHLMFCAATALKNKDNNNVAIIDYYLESNRQLFVSALTDSYIFNSILSFEDTHIRSKFLKRKHRLKRLKTLIKKMPPTDVYTGSDRSVEFQFTMHCASKYSKSVQGHYLDEGTQTYLGHRHMHSFAHNNIDPFFKKLMFGLWWDTPKMIGASKWISTVYATFPALVHPAIKHKTIYPMPKEYFYDPKFIEFSKHIFAQANLDTSPLSRVKFVILLTGDSFYKDVNEHLDKVVNILSSFTNKSRIALKPHPRSKYIDEFKRRHPELIHLDNRVGFELLLTQFSDTCIYLGDVSSVLFTIKWLSKSQKVVAIKLEQKVPEHFFQPLNQLFDSVEVPQLSYEELRSNLN